MDCLLESLMVPPIALRSLPHAGDATPLLELLGQVLEFARHMSKAIAGKDVASILEASWEIAV